MLLESDQTRLRHMLEAAQEAVEYVTNLDRSEFEVRRPLQHSVVRCIEIIGEAASKLSSDLCDANEDVPWRDIIGMRNRLAHAYFDINLDLVWKTAREELPELIVRVETLLNKK